MDKQDLKHIKDLEEENRKLKQMHTDVSLDYKMLKDILDAYYFNDMYRLQRLSDKWREDCKFNHLYQSLGNKPPKGYMPRFDEEFKFFIKLDSNKIICLTLRCTKIGSLQFFMWNNRK